MSRTLPFQAINSWCLHSSCYETASCPTLRLPYSCHCIMALFVSPHEPCVWLWKNYSSVVKISNGPLENKKPSSLDTNHCCHLESRDIIIMQLLLCNASLMPRFSRFYFLNSACPWWTLDFAYKWAWIHVSRWWFEASECQLITIGITAFHSASFKLFAQYHLHDILHKNVTEGCSLPYDL